MKTAAERIAEFKQELEALLTKHRAELSIIDVGRAYSPDLRIFAMMNSVFKHGECVAEYAEEDLGTYLAGKE
jgi:hypothetical protein